MTNRFKRKGAHDLIVTFDGFIDLVKEPEPENIIPGGVTDLDYTTYECCVLGITGSGKKVAIPLMEFLNFYEPADAALNQALDILDKMTDITGEPATNEVPNLTFVDDKKLVTNETD